MKPRIYVESSVISYAASRKSSNALTAYRQQLTQRWLSRAAAMFALETSVIVQFEIAAGDPVQPKSGWHSLPRSQHCLCMTILQRSLSA